MLSGVMFVALCSCLLFMLVNATPVMIYLQQQEPNELSNLADYRPVSSADHPYASRLTQTRYLGDYYPKNLISLASDMSAIKRNIAIGRGDGFRPGK